VPVSRLTQRYDKIHSHTDLPEITLKQIEHFFEHYKDLEPGKWVKLLAWGGAEEARQIIVDAIRREQTKER
jgi:inorganic pyrophosphatase